MERTESQRGAGESIPEQAWDETCRLLASQLPSATFLHWVAPLRLVGSRRGCLRLTATPSVLEWARKRYGRMIGDAVRECSNFEGVYFEKGEQ